ncbi:MAG: hypothetical protein KDA89_23665, partial [Planctomycetaceae bacterium]|nr:hypothetical protein [Planctomycetaceae bacterium]
MSTTSSTPHSANAGFTKSAFERMRQRLFPAAGRVVRGRLGIDIGTNTLKMAQAERRRDGWQIVNRIVLPLPESAGEFDGDIRGDVNSDNIGGGRFDVVRRQLQRLGERPLATSPECVCVLPRDVTDFSTLELPDGDAAELSQMAQEALKDVYVDDFDQRTIQCWRNSVIVQGMAEVLTVSVPTATAEDLIGSLAGGRLDCRCLDPLPIALARAAAMTRIGHAVAPAALLDWGHSGITFVVSQYGRPAFVRTLRGRGSSQFLTSVCEAMNLSVSDARNLVAAVVLPGENNGGGQISTVLRSLLAPELQHLAGELKRTLLYLRHHRPKLVPSHLTLFGGMAAVPNIAGKVRPVFTLPTNVWSLGAENSNSADPMFAAAIGASAERLVC